MKSNKLHQKRDFENIFLFLSIILYFCINYNVSYEFIGIQIVHIIEVYGTRIH